MPLAGTPNQLKRALAEGRPQIGIWSSLCSPMAVEVVADSGFDWMLIDAEHAPNDLSQVVTHLQAAAPYPTEAVVRIAAADPILVKRFLDAGVRSLLVPFVEDVETARHVVGATRYPPHGFRGVSVSHRGNRFGRMKTYLQDARDILFVALQIETRKSVDAILDIAGVEGVDAVFIGPSDLSADLGHLGNAAHPEVQAVIEGAILRCRDAGRPIGILAPVQADAKRYLEMGATMVAVGSDLGLLARASDGLALAFGLQRPAA